MKGALDRLVMLLSSDWFRSHWHDIGLMAAVAEQEQLVQHCRDIVQQMMDGQTEYWNISFEKSRISDTYNRFFDAAERCKLDRHDLEILRSVADENIFLATGSGGSEVLLLSLTQLFVQDSSFRIENGGELSAKLIEKLSAICDAKVAPDFRLLCQASTTSWDHLLRMMTPDLPDHLGDFAELIFNQIDESSRIWAQISSTLNDEDQELLANLYSKMAEDLAGQRIDLRRR
jgi:hypothetical protein